MPRYINADALIKDLKRQYMFLFGTDELPNGIKGVIENFPTADVVEVVRCKDCKFQKVEYGWNCKQYKVCINFDLPMDNEDFCSWGERREDEI